MIPEASAYEQTVARQRQVTAPAVSAWVAANAGSGKTKVLTDRVMRLLLTGTNPARILCITFTKAAAAEMAERLFKRLGEWALMDDETLKKQLSDLDQQAARSTLELSDARRLFARALETPGGLKIQTIHSFCESVLKRFPLEADVSPGFVVMEERDAEVVFQNIVSTLVVEAWQGDEQRRDDFLKLTQKIDESTLRKDIFVLISKVQDIRKAIEEAGGNAAYWHQMANYLGVDAKISPLVLKQRFFRSLNRQWLEGAYSAFVSGKKRDQERALKLRALLDSNGGDAGFRAAEEFFLTSGQLRKQMADNAAKSALPDIEERLFVYQEALNDVLAECNGLELYSTTKAIHELVLDADMHYTEYKKTHGYLDFNDLIQKTAELFHTTAPDWVLYKLDQGLDHILLDEAQDTSDGQWNVIMRPLQEFFAGSGAREIARSVFVVGDEKQSIYSFQGANVDLFRSQQSEVAGLVKAAERDFAVKNLTLSFRSTAPVLQFVDEVFNDPEAAKGVSDDPEMSHSAYRDGDAGLVELWPLVEREEGPEGGPWDAPVDMPGIADPARRLAEHIAGTIARWLDDGELLTASDRPIRPGDIMILCQRRGPVFHETVRALTRRKVPTAGADRIGLKDHVAVKDMLAAARFALQTNDDLSLAELLKSPLFEFEDGDLFEVSYGRSGSQSVWQALCARADNDENSAVSDLCRRAVRSLRAARSIGQRRGPYAFFSYLLETGAPSGWRRMFGRLGPGAREALNEFINEALTFENREPRTLQGFLAHVERLEADLKREIDGTDDLVRVMTVHGSKGLEAEIVFLADAAYTNVDRVGNFLSLGQEKPATNQLFYQPLPGYPVRISSQKQDNAATKEARAYAVSVRAEEYRRLFYVAATRARDRLYICGQATGRSSKEKLLEKPSLEASWYTLAARAFDRLGRLSNLKSVGEAPWGGEILRIESAQSVKIEKSTASTQRSVIKPPAWLYRPAPVEEAAKRITPSSIWASEGDERLASEFEVAYKPASDTQDQVPPYTRGNALHLLLEKLPDIAKAQRKPAGQKLLQKHFPLIEQGIQAEWVAEVLTVLTDPAFADVFGQGSRAEVPIMGSLTDNDQGTVVSGQIDRLVVTNDKVMIVDYKTNRPPPISVDEVPQEYVVQLAAYRALLQEIYPSRQIVCALLWTWEARLMEIPPEKMDHAFVQYR